MTKMWLMRARCNECGKDVFGYDGMTSCPYCDCEHVAKIGMTSFMPIQNEDMQLN